MRTLWRFWILLFVALSLQAQTNLPMYTVLAPKKGEAFVATLDHLSDQGYRVILGGKYLNFTSRSHAARHLSLRASGGEWRACPVHQLDQRPGSPRIPEGNSHANIWEFLIGVRKQA